MKRVGVFNDTSIVGHYGCHAVMSVLDRQLRDHGMEPAFFWRVGHDWRPFRKQITSEQIDAIIVNGEGSIHHSADRPRAAFLSELGSFARNELGVPSVLLNATLYALDDSALRDLANFDMIFVRESESQRYLSSQGLSSRVVPDLSFFATTSAQDKMDRPQGETELVTDSARGAVSRELRQLAQRRGAPFIEMKPGHNAGAPTSLFQRLEISLQSRLRRFRKLPHINAMARALTPLDNFSSFIETLSQSRGVITGRFHTTTLSLAQHVPLVAVESNTPKIASVLRDVLGNTSRVIEPQALGEWLSPIEVARFSAEDHGNIEAYLENGRSALHDMFSRISSTVRS